MTMPTPDLTADQRGFLDACERAADQLLHLYTGNPRDLTDEAAEEACDLVRRAQAVVEAAVGA